MRRAGGAAGSAGCAPGGRSGAFAGALETSSTSSTTRSIRPASRSSDGQHDGSRLQCLLSTRPDSHLLGTSLPPEPYAPSAGEVSPDVPRALPLSSCSRSSHTIAAWTSADATSSTASRRPSSASSASGSTSTSRRPSRRGSTTIGCRARRCGNCSTTRAGSRTTAVSPPTARRCATALPSRGATRSCSSRALAAGPDFEPGEGWAYSNTGYLLVRRIVDCVTPGGFAGALERELLGPLGLNDTSPALELDDLEPARAGLEPPGRRRAQGRPWPLPPALGRAPHARLDARRPAALLDRPRRRRALRPRPADRVASRSASTRPASCGRATGSE